MRALIVGAGIGGLAAALALHRAGVPVTVLERWDAPHDAGAGLSLWPNASRALAALGLESAVAAMGGPVSTGTFVRSDGAVLSAGTVDLRGRYGAPAACVRRGDLLAALRGGLPEGAVALGAEVCGFDGADALLADGGRVAGDVLVGADGLRSAIRRQLGRSQPRACGALAWRGIADVERGGGIAVGPRAHCGWMGVGRGRSYWFACADVPPGTAVPAAGVAAELAERFGGWAEPLPSLIAATPPETLLRHDLYEHPPGGAWGEGPVTLLGDAAHAMAPAMGQGACMALEDAVVLARCLVRPGGTPEEALRAYERLRMRRTARVQRSSSLALRLFQPAGRLGEAVRDAALRLPASWMAGSQGWLYGYDAAAATQ